MTTDRNSKTVAGARSRLGIGLVATAFLATSLPALACPESASGTVRMEAASDSSYVTRGARGNNGLPHRPDADIHFPRR